MIYNKAKKSGDRIAAFACLILAGTCVFIACYQFNFLQQLIKEGKHAEAVVTGIKTGAKGSKQAIYTYVTENGEKVTARDSIQLYFIRLHKGDVITIIYNPDDTNIVTADFGKWIWQAPLIFLGGFIFFLVLGTLIIRYQPVTPEPS